MAATGQTGPKSLAGKKISRMNALKTGLFAKTNVLPFEDEKAYQRHVKLIVASLDPEDSLQRIYAEQIADSIWRGTRQELRASLYRDEVMKDLLPDMVAGMLGIEGERAQRAPDYLVNLKYQISKSDQDLYRKAYKEYQVCATQAKGVANYQAVWRQYIHLFRMFGDWVEAKVHPPLFAAGGEALNLAWQQAPRELESHLAKFADWLWYGIHFEEFKPQIQVYMASWYFLQKQHHAKLDTIDLAIIKERKVCQGLLETYMRYRKSKVDHYLFQQQGCTNLKNEIDKNLRKSNS